MGRKRAKYKQAKTEDETDNSRSMLEHYSNRHEWLKDSHFLKELEGDSVDTEVLDEELTSIQAQTPKTCRGRTLVALESNPFQIALCVLVLLDAGVVIAEILLDLHAIRSQYEHSQVMLNQAAEYLKYSYGDTLEGLGPDDMQYILSTLEHIYAHNVTYAKTQRTKRSTQFPLSDTDTAILEADQVSTRKYLSDNTQKRTNMVTQNTKSSSYFEETSVETDHSKEDISQIFVSSSSHEPAERITQSRFAHDILDGTSSTSTSLGTEAHHILFRIARDASVGTQNSTSSTYPDSKPKIHGATYSYAEKLLKISHLLHYCSIVILAVFVVQFLVKMFCMGAAFFRDKLEMFDAVIITASFALDVIFLEGPMNNSTGEEAAALLIIFLLWRLLRVVNGLMVTSKKRQEFRVKLQKRARRKAERRIEHLEEEKQLHQKEIHSLKDLCMEKGALEMEIIGCKPRKYKSITVEKMNTSAGLSSIAAMSLGFSMSMSGASNASPVSNGKGGTNSVDRPSFPGSMPGYQLHNLMMGGANPLGTPPINKGRSPKRRAAFLSVMRYKKKTLRGSASPLRSQDSKMCSTDSARTKSFEFSPQTSTEVVSPLEISEDKSEDSVSTRDGAQTIQTQQSSLDSANLQVSIDIETTEECWIENESESVDQCENETESMELFIVNESDTNHSQIGSRPDMNTDAQNYVTSRGDMTSPREIGSHKNMTPHPHKVTSPQHMTSQHKMTTSQIVSLPKTTTSQDSNNTSKQIESYQEQHKNNEIPTNCDTTLSSINTSSANKRHLFANRSFPSIGKIFRNGGGGALEALLTPDLNDNGDAKQEALDATESNTCVDTLVVDPSGSIPNRRGRGQSCHTIMQRQDYV